MADTPVLGSQLPAVTELTASDDAIAVIVNATGTTPTTAKIPIATLLQLGGWIAPIADIAALRLVSQGFCKDGFVVRVLDADGAGARKLFEFDEASTDTDNGEAIIKPTAIGVGSPGRWLELQTGGGAGGAGAGAGAAAYTHGIGVAIPDTELGSELVAIGDTYLQFDVGGYGATVVFWVCGHDGLASDDTWYYTTLAKY